MYRRICAAVVAAIVFASPIVATQAIAEKKLTPQQQKMKDCSAKWGDEKKAKKVSGKAAHNKFMSTCLKG